MIELEDIRDENSPQRISLRKLSGTPVKDVTGVLETKRGKVRILLSEIIFEDGSVLDCTGEATPSFKREPKNFDQETLARLEEDF